MKPRETTLKLPKTNRNHLKPAILQYLKISYYQVEFVLILHHKDFFAQIWSQNLKFFKLTKIWYRGRLLYVYFDFKVYYFKIFVIHIFWPNLVPKSEVLQISLNLIQGYIATYLSRF